MHYMAERFAIALAANELSQCWHRASIKHKPTLIFIGPSRKLVARAFNIGIVGDFDRHGILLL